MYLFFSSDAFDLYRRDIISALALPESYTAHFRYPKEFLPKDDTFIPAMRGKDGIIVYVRGNKQEEELEDRDVEFLPIREVTVLDIDDNATTGLVHVFLGLKGFVKTDPLKATFSKVPETVPPYKFVYLSNDTLPTKLCAWHDKISELVAFDAAFENTLFYSLDIKNQEDNDSSQTFITYDRAERCSSFKLTDGKQYTLDLAIYNSSKNSRDYERHSIKLDYDSENFFITNPENIIIGADRDNRSFKIVTKDLKSHESASYIKIQSVFRGPNEDDKEVISCEEVIRLNIRRSNLKLRAQLISSFCTFLGSVLGAYGASQLKADGYHPIPFIIAALVFFLGSSYESFVHFGKN